MLPCLGVLSARPVGQDWPSCAAWAKKAGMIAARRKRGYRARRPAPRRA
ncbi:hypothetical protein PCLA_01r0827 [Pseudomonas citronellolis]|nr:hypothetical protein PCLA_01r0827 [Pseudomonas citronellolis]